MVGMWRVGWRRHGRVVMQMFSSMSAGIYFVVAGEARNDLAMWAQLFIDKVSCGSLLFTY